ncbi:universal stress protein [Flagellimonas meishanensis]|uniref:universal stress protein n=1 Tax=Flagellimonas meishanensis TaxID=2873264 RepID=UPI001CA6B863|nr:universal stress protein [[Muricauda] meishanensis]
METLVCAIDYSQNSVAALKMAQVLGRQLGMRLMALHVFDMDLTFANPLSTAYAKKEKEAFAKQGKTLKEFCATHLGLGQNLENVELKIKEHAIVREGIAEVITEYNASLLVMGLQGKSALKEVFIGSNTKDMVMRSTCPVLAVPPHWEKFEVENMLYATDFEEADIHAIDWLVKTFAKSLGSKISVFHISTEKEYAGEDQMQWFQEMLQQKVTYGKISFEMVRSEDVFGTLLKQVKNTQADVLVMLEREREGFFTSLIQGDKVMQMISKGNVPLLAVNKSLFR